MLFIIAKKNLIAGFKARFKPNENGYSYYPKEYDNPFECTQEQYNNYVNNFEQVLKFSARILWFCLIIIIPLMLWFEMKNNFEFDFLKAGILFLLPFPLLAIRVSKAYNAPNELTNSKWVQGKQRNTSEIKEARIKGMSWLMLIAGNIVPAIGIYIISIDNSLRQKDKKPLYNYMYYHFNTVYLFLLEKISYSK